MMGEHIGDLAGLYAVGALGDAEKASLELHLQTCSSCRQLVGSAQDDVALIASLQPRHDAPAALTDRIQRLLREALPLRVVQFRRRFNWPVGIGLAAALLIGILPSTYLWEQNRALRGAMLAQNAAMERLAVASYRTASFRSASGRLAAQVMYAPDGSWYVVVVRDVSKTLQVAWMHDGTRTMLGSAIPRGDLATLYLRKSHRMDRLALMDGDRVVAEATLSWQRTAPNRQGARSG
jgi:Putative zinc-finger